jgi:ferredoxin-NADP reductase
VIEAPSEADVAGETYQSRGRIGIDLLKRLLPFDDYDFYLCGPGPMTQSLHGGLRALNVADERIHAEARTSRPCLSWNCDIVFAGRRDPDPPLGSKPVL